MQELVDAVTIGKPPLSGATNTQPANSAHLSEGTRTFRIKIPPCASLDTTGSTQSTASTAILHPFPARARNSGRTDVGHTSHRRASSSRSLPTAGLVIPNVPVRNPNGTRRPKSESWRDIIKHWKEGDPALGLHTPLRDWPPEWTRGSNRLFAVKYHQRSLIALEFLNTYHSDEARFLTAYPEAAKGHTALVRAINAARQARGEREVRAWKGCSSGTSSSP